MAMEDETGTELLTHKASWVPDTPIKPIPPRTEPICKDMHGSPPGSGGSSYSKEFPPGFGPPDELFSCGSRLNYFERGDNSSWPSGPPVTRQPFMKLLALADPTVIGNGPSSASVKYCSTNFNHAAQNTDGNLNHPANAYDVNLSPKARADATSDGATPYFAPITPDKALGVQSRMAFDNHDAKRLIQEGNEYLKELLKVQATDDESMIRTPQQKPRRKKHRPKVVSERKPRRTPKPRKPKSALTEGETRVRRKYVRRKGIEKQPSTLSTEVDEHSSRQNRDEPFKKSCKRALDFDSEQQQENGTIADQSVHVGEPKVNDSHTQVQWPNAIDQLPRGIEAEARDAREGIADELNHSISQKQREGMTIPKSWDPRMVPSAHFIQQEKAGVHCSLMSLQGGNQANSHASPNDMWTKKTSSQNTTFVTEAEQLPDLKRKYSDSCGKIQNGYANMSGIQFNSIQAYESISWLHSPNAYKRRRAEDVLDSAASATSSSGVPNLPQEKEMQFQDKQQVNDCILDFSQAGRSAKRRSNGLARVQNSAPLTKPKEYCVVATHPPQRFTAHEKLHNACTSMQALLLEMNANRSRKKRAKKNPLIHSSYSTPVSLQPNRCVQGHTDQYHGAFTSTPGQLPEILLQHITPVDAIANLLEDLDINKDSRGNAFKEQKALIPYGTGNPEHQNMLVLYSRDGTIVPYDPDKRRQPRPKVDLDEETNRVWKLLLEDINSQGVDGTDEEKARWWQEERRVFKGRTDSFIARMHLVQGDRRFSPWKGSVLDSVVGVFLTQNVSDHLSSSAFMSLAAQFPNKQMQSKCFEEGTSSVINEPLDLECTSKWIEKMSSSPVCDRSSVTVNDTGNTDELEVVNSDKSRRGSSGKITSKNDSKCHFFSSNSSGNEKHSHPTVSKLTMDIIKLICDNEDRKAEVDVISSQDSAASCQRSQDIAKAVRNEIKVSTSDNSEIDDLTDMRKLSEASRADGPASFMELLNWASAKTRHESYEHESGNVSSNQNSRDGLIKSLTTDHGGGSRDNEALNAKNPAVLEGECSDDSKEHIKFSESCKVDSASSTEDRVSTVSQATTEDKIMTDIDENPGISLQCDRISTTQFSLEYRRRSCLENHSNQKSVEKCASERVLPSHKESTETNTRTSKAKTSAEGKARKAEFDWDSLRRHAEPGGSKRPRSPDTMDSIDWESVRCADVNEIAQTIKDRGMNNVLAGRIQDFLNRLVNEHGSLDLEWLRDVPPDKAKEFLLSFRGLGLKSVECVRLLTLHHLAFPVDTNVGRIAVRLGWVPLQPLPESLQLHLLELYPILESIQKYLWPRLCKLDQRTLYELHYQMITFGKVFCTKSKPNCNACPMRGECRHFASAFASARLALPGPEQTSIVCSSETLLPTQNNPKHLLLPPILEAEKPDQQLMNHGQSNCQPIIEEPASPGPEYTKIVENDEGEIDMEDFGEIPTIKLNIEEFTQNLQNYMQQTMELQEGDMSKALVALTPEAASLPAPKLKNVSRLRTEHLVYEIPDGHPLLNGLDKLEPDDPSKYLLAIWTPGETANSVAPPEQHCNSRDHGTLCNVETCFACRCIREENSHTVRGTILIPCRTAMRGSFPLNGTYFQVNEVFADHESSLQPMDVPRDWLWKLQRRTVYFGTSIPAIFKGLSTEGIQHCFWRGYVCVRGFDRQSRAPRPLIARLHFPASKMAKFKGKPEDES